MSLWCKLFFILSSFALLHRWFQKQRLELLAMLMVKLCLRYHCCWGPEYIGNLSVYFFLLLFFFFFFFFFLPPLFVLFRFHVNNLPHSCDSWICVCFLKFVCSCVYSLIWCTAVCVWVILVFTHVWRNCVKKHQVSLCNVQLASDSAQVWHA